MAIKHGNKIYYQVLLDPARGSLLESMANAQSLINNIAYPRYCLWVVGFFSRF